MWGHATEPRTEPAIAPMATLPPLVVMFISFPPAASGMLLLVFDIYMNFMSQHHSTLL